MRVLKCKICGGNMELSDDRLITTCDSCGSTMTVPKIDDDLRADQFNRGTYYRKIGEYDKAATVYENLLPRITWTLRHTGAVHYPALE